MFYMYTNTKLALSEANLYYFAKEFQVFNIYFLVGYEVHVLPFAIIFTFKSTFSDTVMYRPAFK